MSKPRLLDLFCGAGGAGMGYHRAGFEVVGVDIEPQPHYPFEFHQADAMTFPLDGFDAIHASPPCQAFSTATGRGRKERGLDAYPRLIAPMRARLKPSHTPFVIENVVGAPLVNAFRLCGSSFGLNLQRHRLFEPGGGWCPVMVPPCAHHWQTRRFKSLDGKRKNLARVVGVHGHVNYTGEAELRREAMGIGWMTQTELTQAIPPAYTEWIGSRVLEALKAAA